ncbi:MAG: glycosyltransferase family 39 protein, partial [Patescibacteria group bacterium]
LLGLIIIIAAFLRLNKLSDNPPSLYWDEASLGYNAFAILTTGHDEHGELLPLARFIAFGDYKPPGYIYAIVPFMALFGVGEFAIRFPSAFSGILMVIFTYWLAKKITGETTVGLAAAGLLAISPWSLQLSRAAFEAHLAALFNLTAICLFIAGIKRHYFMPISALFFILSFYTFNANRILTPIFILVLLVIYWKDSIKIKKWLVISVTVGLLLLVPSLSYLRSRESRLRFQEVTIFTSLNTITKANARIMRDGDTWWSRIIHNRRVYYAKDFLSHYADHFKGEFLFISGDRNPRLSILDVGELYWFEIPLIIIGVILLLFQRSKTTALLIAWGLFAPIPAATARETPHMLRTASILPIPQIICGIAAVWLWNFVKTKSTVTKRSIYILVTLIVLVNLLYYFHNYWVHYPRDWSSEWQYGYSEMVTKVREHEDNYDRISVTQANGRPYIYFLLFNHVNPIVYMNIRKADRDWYGLWNVYGFGKYDFTEKPPVGGERVLRVKTGSNSTNKKIDEVKDPSGKTVFEIGE